MDSKRAREDSGPSDSHLRASAIHRTYSPRLPTPEASRHSDATSSTSSTISYVSDIRRGPAVSDLLSFRPHYPTTHFRVVDRRDVKDVNKRPFVEDGRDEGEVKDIDTRPSSKEGHAPRSPPYPVHDERKPLLPPLKMVIANAMNSPPETPRADGASLQPSPREPSLSAATFKPLAFYPNKKLRTENRPAQWQGINDRPSPPRAIEHSSSYPSYHPHESNKRQRRYSHHSQCTSARCYDNPDKSYYAYSGRPNSSGTQPATHYEKSTFERFPISPSSEYGRTDGPLHRPAPFQAEVASRSYNVLPAPSPEYEHGYQRHIAESAYRGTSYEHGRAEHRRDFGDHSTCRDSSCHANSGAFFMPSPYDYAQGKSRKRSNLPKQSTEIMKTWFDNNISNPYPSEEQKLTFSKLTGISMTQVSNWFINHRRRCPELREKRERVRTGGLLED